MLQDTGENVSDGGIYLDRTKTAADYQNNRTIRTQMGKLKTGKAIAFQQLLADWGTGQQRLIFWKIGQSFRKIAA